MPEKTKWTAQELWNLQVDDSVSPPRIVLGNAEWDGNRWVAKGAAYAIKMTVVGSVTYVGKAAPGSLQSDPVWQAMKIDESSGMVITWADGDAQFDNSAVDLASLNYL